MSKSLPKLAAVCVVALSAAVATAGQATPDSAVSFEAASVKALKVPKQAFHFKVLPNRLDVENMSLLFLIKQAYELRDDQVSGPEWLANHRYDIVATSGEPVPKEIMRMMLRNLLMERLHLASHWETRTMAMYRLVALPQGPRMKTAEHGYDLPNSPMVDNGSVRLDGPMSMPQLAERLTRHAGMPVVDTTNLDGYFTVALTFASDDMRAGPSDGDFAAPLLTSAIQEQLGLKLVPATGPVKILIIDHAEPVPTAN